MTLPLVKGKKHEKHFSYLNRIDFFVNELY
jgi:hypothetical protein